jgi:hypothetical protein
MNNKLIAMDEWINSLSKNKKTNKKKTELLMKQILELKKIFNYNAR